MKKLITLTTILLFAALLTACSSGLPKEMLDTTWKWQQFTVVSSVDVPEGETTLRFEFEPTGVPDIREGLGAPGWGQLYIDGELVGNTEFWTSVPITFGIEGLSCGYDFGEAVTHEYETPFTFTGMIKQVTVDISGELFEDDEAKVRMLMSQQ